MAVTMKSIQETIGPAGQAEFVKLLAGKPSTFRIKDANLGEKTVEDKETGEQKTLKALNVEVVRENGTSVEKMWGITSKRLANALGRDLETKRYLKQDLKVTMFGQGYDTTYEFEWVGQ